MLAFLVGVLLKLYDDFVDDEQILTNEHLISTLRTLQIGITSLVLANDFWTCLLFVAFNLACVVSSYTEYIGPHVFSFLVLSPFLLATSWKHKSSFGSKLDIAGISIILGSGLVEPKLFPEESSIPKAISRFLGVLFTGWLYLYFPFSLPIQAFLLISCGYSLASVFGQMVKLGFIPSGQIGTYLGSWSEQHTQHQEQQHQSS